MAAKNTNWKDIQDRLAGGSPDEWPAGLRDAVRRPGAALPADLERFEDFSARLKPADRVVHLPSRRSLRRRAVRFAAAAVFLLVVGAIGWNALLPDPPDMVVHRLKGAPELSPEDVAIGKQVVLPADSVLEFSFAEGVHLQLVGPARIDLRRGDEAAGSPALDFHLLEGEVFFVSRNVSVSKRFAFATNRARYTLTGTAGLLTVRPQVEILRVVEGGVDVRRHGIDQSVRVPEANWMLVDKPDAGDVKPILIPTDQHSFRMLCRRRDRLLTFVWETPEQEIGETKQL